jgi:hypothetical protein
MPALPAPVTCLVVALAALGVPAGQARGDRTSVAPVSWAYVQQKIDRQAGSFTKTMSVEFDDKQHVLTREWFAFDFGKRLVDRRVVLGDDLSTPRIELPAGRNAPDLRFVYAADGVLMWNPGARSLCKTPWVDMGPAVMKQFGLETSDFLVNEPAQILHSAHGKPQMVQNDADVTIYVVPVSGGSGLSALALSGLPVESGKLKNAPLFIEFPHGDGPIVLSLDLTDAIEKLTGKPAGDGRMWIVWKLDRRPLAPQAAHPANVAASDCLR